MLDTVYREFVTTYNYMIIGITVYTVCLHCCLHNQLSNRSRPMRVCVLTLALCVLGSANPHEGENLFDKVWTQHMRDKDSPLTRGKEHIACVPSTGEECVSALVTNARGTQSERRPHLPAQSEREVAYIKEVENFDHVQLKNATATLIKEERAAHQAGRKPTEAEERWMLQRKSILYHLQDDREASKTARWAKMHDEL